MLIRKGILAVLICLFAAAPSRAEGWRSLPIWGADVRSLAIHPEDPSLVFAGTSAGQLYLSRDGGRSWGNAGAALPFPGWLVSSLRFDPNRPERLWVSLQGIWGSGHVASSDDLGKTWETRSGGLPNEPAYVLALVPGREGHLYTGTLSGVWGTENNGKSWRRLTGDLPEVQKVTSLYVDPRQPDTVIAGTWRRAYRSADAGRTWAGIFEGMVLDSEVFSLTPVADRPGEIWATTCGWVYRTLDGGNTWARFKEGFEERRTPSFSALPGGLLLAGTVAGLHASEDGGLTWKRRGDPALAILSIAYHPRRPERILLGTEGSGVWLSTDGGANFRPSSEGMTNTRVSALASAGEELFVAISHGGPISGIHVSTDRGRTFGASGAHFSPLPTVLDIAWHAGRIYAATERGLYERRGTGWNRFQEIGDIRIEEIVSDGTRLVARGAAGLWELKGPRFVAQPSRLEAPRSAAFFDGALWVTNAKGVYRADDAILAPFAGGRLQRLEDQLLLWGSGGAWVRMETEWVELTDKATRLLPTGSPRWPALMVSGETVRLYDPEARKFRVIEVPVPARDLWSALVLGGRLLLGTSGYGVLERDLDELLPPAPPPAAVAVAPEP